MRYVITGATGMLGRSLIEHCSLKGDEVLAVCRKNSKRLDSIPKNEKVSILELNLDEFEPYAKQSKKNDKEYDVFVHMAWEGTTGLDRNDVTKQLNNVKYSLDAVKLADYFGCKRFVGVGSQAEYGRVDGVISSSSETKPETAYGVGKLFAGQMTKILCNQLSIEHVWSRVVSAYGPYDGANTMIMSNLKRMINNEDVPLTGCEQTWDYIYCSDAAKAIYLISRKGINGKTYIIASGISRKLREFVEVMHAKTNSTSKLNFGEIPYSDKQVMNLSVDISDLMKDTGFKPNIGFEDGIERTLDYIKK